MWLNTKPGEHILRPHRQQHTMAPHGSSASLAVTDASTTTGTSSKESEMVASGTQQRTNNKQHPSTTKISFSLCIFALVCSLDYQTQTCQPSPTSTPSKMHPSTTAKTIVGCCQWKCTTFFPQPHIFLKFLIWVFPSCSVPFCSSWMMHKNSIFMLCFITILLLFYFY